MNETNSNLEFRKIKSLDFLYEINENGTIFRNVKSKKQNKIKLDMHHSQKGYYATFCRFKGTTTRIMIHKAVAECWLGDRPDGYEIDHRDRNSHNNHYTNLRYVTKSEQMKNRDHSGISKTGAANLENARRERMKPVAVRNETECISFESYAQCSRWMAQKYNVKFDSIRSRLKAGRSHIYDYDIIYLNAETGHGSSTEQGTAHESDLTGNYTTAFNRGKQQEVQMRVKHDGRIDA